MAGRRTANANTTYTTNGAFIGHSSVWAVGHLAIVAFLAYGLGIGDRGIVKVAVTCLAAWSPLLFTLGFLAMRRSWLGEPENEIVDVVLPVAAIVACAFFGSQFFD